MLLYDVLFQEQEKKQPRLNNTMTHKTFQFLKISLKYDLQNLSAIINIKDIKY